MANMIEGGRSPFLSLAQQVAYAAAPEVPDQSPQWGNGRQRRRDIENRIFVLTLFRT